MPDSAIRGPRPISAIGSALDQLSLVTDAVNDRTLLLFLDFDGTLAPIVNAPGDAALDPEVRRTLETLVSRTPVAILSGRDRADVQARVGVQDIVYAGSHGLDIRGPGLVHQVGLEALPALDRARARLDRSLTTIEGTEVEPKKFGLAVHYRRMDGQWLDHLEALVAEVAGEEPSLRVVRGKKVVELRPDVDWDKGSALTWLATRLPTAGRGSGLRLYIGDDVTDEDAFRAVGAEGVSIVVRGEDDTRMSRARFSLADPGDVAYFLSRLADSGDSSLT
ncbi:MAG: trehalose-phosphatase [Longimicrobiales bacterium]